MKWYCSLSHQVLESGELAVKLLQRKELTADHPLYLAVVKFVSHLSCGLGRLTLVRTLNNEGDIQYFSQKHAAITAR